MINLALLVGVRPQFIKAAPVINCLKADANFCLQLIHSGQHYDYEMSKLFFKEMDLPSPNRNLNIGSSSHALQTGNMIIRMEETLTELQSDVLIVFGDANTTLAGALAAIKMRIPICHIESGLRSYDKSMPEEINRILVDHCSQLLCTPTDTAVNNLYKEGISDELVFLSGDTMYDAFLQHKEDINNSTIVKDMGLMRASYAVLTLHRAENVDNIQRLERIMTTLLNDKRKVIFPVHPRTAQRLKQVDLYNKVEDNPNVVLSPPLGYFEILNLIQHAKYVLTDSGGIQKEAYFLHVPCITLRYNTEWIETVKLGVNTLVGAEPKLIKKAISGISDKNYLEQGFSHQLFGDGFASQKINEEIYERYHTKKMNITSNNR